jgi:hypothetical protein
MREDFTHRRAIAVIAVTVLAADCPPVTVGLVGAGQTRSTGVLNVARTCGYHDHDRDFDDDLRGTIIVGQ